MKEASKPLPKALQAWYLVLGLIWRFTHAKPVRELARVPLLTAAFIGVTVFVVWGTIHAIILVIQGVRLVESIIMACLFAACTFGMGAFWWAVATGRFPEAEE